jgi:cytochrome oxidase Cu insertion factor (SCO1/SenC/PrrC family)
MNRALMFWLATLLVFGGGTLIWTLTKAPDDAPLAGSLRVVDEGASSLSARPKLTEFELIDQTGKRVNSQEFNGQVWAGSFFFAACPSTCYNQNIKLQQLHARYADQGLQLVSITCDPGNDTPAALAGYASRFNADATGWKFLTPADADMQYVSRIANDFFGVAVGPETHTDRVVLFDRSGKILGSYNVLNAQQYRQLDEQIERALSAMPNGATDGTSQEDAASTGTTTIEEIRNESTVALGPLGMRSDE